LLGKNLANRRKKSDVTHPTFFHDSGISQTVRSSKESVQQCRDSLIPGLIRNGPRKCESFSGGSSFARCSHPRKNHQMGDALNRLTARSTPTPHTGDELFVRFVARKLVPVRAVAMAVARKRTSRRANRTAPGLVCLTSLSLSSQQKR